MLAVAIIIGSIITVVFSQRQAQTFKIQQQQFVKSQFQHCSYMDLVVVPILKVYGEASRKKRVTKDIITAYVSKDGAVTFKGELRKDAVNPIVKLNLKITDKAIWIRMLRGLKCTD